MKTLHVIKIGGAVLEDPELLEPFLDDFQAINGPKILVHGGGNKASELSDKLQIDVKMVRGRRVTDSDSLDVALMVYAGLLNKKLVATLQGRGCNAVGLSGADMNLIRAVKRPVGEIDYGLVGDVTAASVDTEKLELLLNGGVVPIFCALTHDGKGQMFNTNADSLASVLARSMSGLRKVSLTFCFTLEGVLRDVEDPSSLIPTITSEDYEALKQNGTIHEGMIPKMENAFAALEHGVQKVYIKKASQLLTDTGTTLTL
ncbi:MAG: acetylglutamate kinase [Balneolaceae bacterium]